MTTCEKVFFIFPHLFPLEPMSVVMRHVCFQGILAGVFLCQDTIALGFEDPEIEYLFAGMSQERSKLKSGTYTIKGSDLQNGLFELNLTTDGTSVRFTRKTNIQAGYEETSACANLDKIVIWD